MSNFTFTCPKCNQQLEAEEEWIGMQTECPCCKQTVTIEKVQEASKIVLKAVGHKVSNQNLEKEPANYKKNLVQKVIIRTEASPDAEIQIRQVLQDALESKFPMVTEENGIFFISMKSMVKKLNSEITITRRDDSTYEIAASTSTPINVSMFFSLVGTSVLLVMFGLFFSISAIIAGFIILILTLILEIKGKTDYFNKIQSCLDETKSTFRR